MKARRLIADAAYGPDTLKILYDAFDDAWKQIAPNISTRADAVEAARLKLAELVLSLAKNANLDAQRLADTAVQLMMTDIVKFRRDQDSDS